MPIYEYQCEECHERFELLVRSSAQQATPTCPKCGSGKVKRAMSLFGVGGTRSSASNNLCQVAST
jgi:putative FmdB family regulatory protein